MWGDKEQRTNCVTCGINEKLDRLSSSQPQYCIFKVFDRLKRVNEEAYKPKTICIGPYHHHERYQNATLKLMEEHKLRYLRNFVRRTNVSVLTCVEAMQGLEEKARNCYAEPINDLNSNEFVEMMLLDGCFIVEFLRKNERRSLEDENDPIFKMDHISAGLIMDLLLSENQLPFFVLDEFFKMARINLKDSISMAICAFEILLPSIELSRDIIGEIQNGEIQNVEIEHLLSLMHYCWCFPYEKMLSEGNDQDANRCMDSTVKLLIEHVLTPCRFSAPEPSSAAIEFMKSHTKSASELQEFGIKFESSNSSKLFDVTFKNGTIRIPALLVQDGTESTLRSLIAYEQYLPNNDQKKYFTHYSIFMDDLVNSSKDVKMLRHKRIISNFLGEDEVVSGVFNKLVLEINEPHNSPYLDICREVNKRCVPKCQRQMASLRRNYCNSPWALISILAATILLLLTVVQTIFSILSVTKSS